MMISEVRSKIYRPDIDGLRAFAVLAVILFHAFPHTFPGGFIGVDIFFVISGYLITSIILADINRQQFSLIRFYQKRIKRIFPALLIFLLACLGAGFYLLFDSEYAHLAKHVYSSALFMNNFVLIHEAGYFDKISDLKPLLHLWSLGIEEQFYLIWPLLLWVLSRSKKTLFWGMLCLVIASFVINLLRIQHHSVDAFFSPQSRIWELGVGGLWAYFRPQINFSKNQTLSINLICLFSLLVLVFKFSRTYLYPSWYACLPCLATILLIGLPSKVNETLLSHPKMVFLGLISYPLYLWHWGLLSFARIIYGGQISGPLTLTLLLVSGILSWLSYRWLEYPIRHQLQPKYENWLLGLLLLGLVSIGFIGFKIVKEQGLPKRKINQVLEFKQDLNHFDDYQKKSLACHLDGAIRCWQNRRGLADSVIWGDSHAEQLFAGLVQENVKNNWLLLQRHACPPFLGVQAYWQGQKEGCQQFNSDVMQFIVSQKNISRVVLASLGLFYLSDESQHSNQFPRNFHLELAHHPKLRKKEVFVQGLENTIAALEHAGKEVIIMEDIPLLPFMPEACISRPLKYQSRPCNLPKSFVWQVQREYHELLMQIQARHPGVKVFSGVDAICHQRSCPIIQNSHLVYRDSQHLSLAGSRILAQAFIRDLV